MNQLDQDVQVTLSQFSTLTSAVIDSSSLIYLTKINAYNHVASTITLYTVQSVLSECSAPFLNLHVINPNTIESTDNQVFQLAKTKGLPVISDDYTILNKTSKAGLPYFNTLMVITYLLYIKEISEDYCTDLLFSLKKIARYNDFVWKYGESVYAAVCANRK